MLCLLGGFFNEFAVRASGHVASLGAPLCRPLVTEPPRPVGIVRRPWWKMYQHGAVRDVLLDLIGT